VNQGVGLEAALPSYPATEEDMRKAGDITKAIREGAKIYKAKSYASIWHKNQIDLFAQAILQNKGCITGVYGTNKGWSIPGGWVVPPTIDEGPNVWGHAFYCYSFGMKNGKKFVRFLNSWGRDWGDLGHGYLGEDYFSTSNVFSAWTLVDLPNPQDIMLRLVKTETRPETYAIVGEERFWIVPDTMLHAGHEVMWDQNKIDIVSDEELAAFKDGGVFGRFAVPEATE